MLGTDRACYMQQNPGVEGYGSGFVQPSRKIPDWRNNPEGTRAQTISSKYRNITNSLMSITISLDSPITADQSVSGEIVPIKVSYTWSVLTSMSSLAAFCRTPSICTIREWLIRRVFSITQLIMAMCSNGVVYCICFWPICQTCDHDWCSF